MKQVITSCNNSWLIGRAIYASHNILIRHCLLLCLFLLPSTLYAQSNVNFVYVVDSNNKISLLDGKWKFINADDSAMAAPDYNDSSWVLLDTKMEGDSNMHLLNGVGWFRKKFHITDSLANTTFALNMEHYGASEIYLDGKFIEQYGTIDTNDKGTKYLNPTMDPYMFHFKDTGMHTIAVRFANYRTEPQLKQNEDYFHGFRLSIKEANKSFKMHLLTRMGLLGLFSVLGAMFLTLAGLHFLLWAFHTSDKSNLYLSFLCIAFCMYFFMMSYSTQSSDVDAFLHRKHSTSIFMTIALVSLSALLNELFGKFRLRFYAIVALCGIAMVFTLKDMRYEGLVSALVMMLVMLEASVLVISAVRNKVKGSKILAFGVLPLAVSNLIIYIIRLFSSNSLDNIGSESLDGFAQLFVIVFSILLFIALAGIPLSMSAFLAWRFATVNKDLGRQLDEVKKLSEQTQEQAAEKKRILENQKEELEKEVAERTSEIIEEKKKSDDLLHNILPEEVAAELKERGATTAHQFDHVTVLFTDFVNFTQAGERMGSQALVEELHNCFKAFDEIMGKHGIEKIKTIGDAYLAVCGLPTADEHHAEKVVMAAQDILNFMLQRREQLGDKTFEIRIGIHSGEVVAGIVGVKKFAYDIWGDTVNTAARMESNSEPGKINISQTTYKLVQDKFNCTYRGELEAKNKGKLKMYFVEG